MPFPLAPSQRGAATQRWPLWDGARGKGIYWWPQSYSSLLSPAVTLDWRTQQEAGRQRSPLIQGRQVTLLEHPPGIDGRHPAQTDKVACLIRCLNWGFNGTEAGRQRWEGKAEGAWGNIQCKGPEPGACCESNKEPKDAVELTTKGRMMAGGLAFWTLAKD